MQQKLHGGKKRLIWIMICGVLCMSIPIQASAKQKPFAQKECETEIDNMKIAYQNVWDKREISQELYREVMNFLDGTSAEINEENCITVYEEFPEKYQQMLYRYLKQNNQRFLHAEKDSITYVLCKADKGYIQKELAVYGAEINQKELDAQTKCEREINQIKSAYISALKKAQVSENLYDVAIQFLEGKEFEMIEKDAIMVAKSFSRDYVLVLKRYCEEEMNNLGDQLVNATDQEIKEYKKQYNTDMLFIEGEIEIQTGKRVQLQFSEKQFQEEFEVLTAVG